VILMKINRAYKVELNTNNKQRTLLEKSVGCARFAYNWGLNERIELYKTENTIYLAEKAKKQVFVMEFKNE
jgi:transposase